MALAAHDGDVVKSRPENRGKRVRLPPAPSLKLHMVHVAQGEERPENGWAAWREGCGCTEGLVAGSVGKRVSKLVSRRGFESRRGHFTDVVSVRGEKVGAMARFNGTRRVGATPTGATSPVKTTETRANTYEGAAGFLRDVKSELFNVAVVNMVGQDTFYESGNDRDDRYEDLIHELAIGDPAWTFELLRWLRGPDGNLRTASLMGASEFVKARLDAQKYGKLLNPVPTGDHAFTVARWNRRVVDAVQQRADEPGELIAYWIQKYGRNLPQPIKRGVADGVKRLYTERGYLRYDSSSKGFRFADVIDLVHPSATAPWQGDLYRHVLNERHGRNTPVPESLTAIRARQTINSMSPLDRHKLARLALRHGLEHNLYRKAMAGQWEWLLSSLGDTTGVREPVSKLDQWRLVLPQLGYMALVRNLRNLSEAGLTGEMTRQVSQRLSDPNEVAKSRMFPFRFWSAYQATEGGFAAALDDAFTHSMRNIPALPGRTLVLVDTSASMHGGLFARESKMSPVQAAAIFGVAVAVRNPGAVDLMGFASGEFRHDVPTGALALAEVRRFISRVGEVGHGTDIHGAVQRQFKRDRHDRVIIISDMQTMATSGRMTHDVVPPHVPIYGFNLGGYRVAATPSGRPYRHEFGGLTDATFKHIPMLERGVDTGWPWELDSSE